MESKYPLRAVDFSGGQRGEGRSRKEGGKKQAGRPLYLPRQALNNWLLLRALFTAHSPGINGPSLVHSLDACFLYSGIVTF